MNPSDQSFWPPSYQAQSVASQPSDHCTDCTASLLQESLHGTQAELEGYRTLYESLPSIYFTLDLSGAILRVNQFGAACLGYDSAELTLRSIFQVTDPTEHVQLQRELSQCLTHSNQVARWEMRLVCQSGQVLWVKASAKRSTETPASLQLQTDNPIILLVCEDITEQKQSEERLAKINECFLHFGPDPVENINRLTQLAGELLSATWALYNRFEQGSFCAIAQWQVPVDVQSIKQPEDYICWQVIQQGGNDLFVVRDLPQSPYAQNDPNIRAYQLKTYVGQGVKCKQDYVGALCIFYQHDCIPSPADHRLIGIIASAIGVEEERRQAELALRQANERFQLATTAVNALIYEWDLPSGLVERTQGLWNVVGYTPEEAEPTVEWWRDRLHPDDWHTIQREFAEISQQTDRQHFAYEYRVRHRDQQDRYVWDQGLLVRDSSGQIVRVIGSTIDITARKQAEESLKQQKELLQTVFDHIPVMLALFDETGHIQMVNRAWEQTLGWSAAELLDQDVFSQIYPDPDYRQEVLAFIVAATGKWQDFRTQIRNGQVLSISWANIRLSDGSNIGIGQDVSDRRQVEQERERLLAELENKGRLLEAVLHQMPAGVMIAEAPSGRLILSNWQVSQILQRSIPPIASIAEYAQLQGLYADGQSYQAKNWPLARALQQGDVVTDEEINFLRADRSLGTMHVSASPVRDREGRIVAGVATFQNVTERKYAEVALRQSEERFRQMAENIREIFWMSSPDRRQMLYVSPAYEVIWGRSCQSLYTHPESFFEAIHPQDLGRVQAVIAQPNRGEYDEEYRIVRPDGSVRWIRDRAFPVQDRAGQIYRIVGVTQDITDQREAKEVLQHQAERERLVGAIAQRIRQSLNIEETLNTTVAEVRQFLQTDRVIIYRFHPEGDGVVVVESVAAGWRPISGTIVHDSHFASSYVQLYLQGRVQAVEDIYTAGLTQCHVDLLASFQVRANLVVPIVQENTLWGLLVAQQCRAPRRWQPIEVDLLKQLATHASIAIQQSELYHQAQLEIKQRQWAETTMRQQAERERLIGAIAQRIRQSLDLEEILNTTVAEVRQFLQVDRTVIFRFGARWQGVVAVESVDPAWDSILGTTIYDPCFEETYVQLYKQGRVKATADIYHAGLAQCHIDLLVQFQVRANLIVPILQGDRLWGLLVAHHCQSERQWQQFEIDLLQQLATQVAIAIQQSELYQQAQLEIVYRQRAEAALRQQVEREHLISGIAQRIRQSLNLEAILNTTVAEVRRFLSVDRVLMYRVWQDGTGSAVTESVAAGWPQILGQSFPEEVFPVESQQRYSQGRTLAIADIDQTTVLPCLADFVHQFGVKAKLVVPILQEQSLWGLLIAHHCSGTREWQAWEIEFLKQLATQVAIALQQSELYRQVQLLNANLEHQVQERTAQLQRSLNFTAALQRITDKVRDSLDERQILQTAVQELTEILQAAYCYAALYNSERTTATINYEYSPLSLGSALGQVIPILNVPKIHVKLLGGKSEQGDRGGRWVYPHLTQPLISRLLSPIFDNQGAIGYLGVFHQAHYQFSDMELQLVQQVANQCAIAIRQARLYQAAQLQVEELEKVNRLKDDFLSTVSHELRTPVTNMKMAAQMLAIALNQDQAFLAEMSKPKAERSRTARYFQILHDECEREISLINDLLDLQRLDAGVQPLSAETIHLQDWLPRLAEPFLERIQNHQRTFELQIAPDLPSLISDSSSLSRAVTELLHNACKYTPAGERIAIAAQRVASGCLQLQVSNSGTTIPSHELPRIFDKFYRVPSADPWRQGGTGLGLALVKKIIEHLGGQIQVTSDDQATCFTLDLPLVPSK